MDSVVVDLTRDDIYGMPFPHKGGAFVAYRMSSEVSRRFRHELETGLSKRGNFTVFDGRVDESEQDWAKAVRSSISKSKLFIADVSGPSNEVMFEMGFAGGKHPLLVTETEEHRRDLPRWITQGQVTDYSGGGTARVISAVITKLQTPIKASRTPQVIPGCVKLVIGQTTQDNAAFNHLNSLIKQEPLINSAEIVDVRNLSTKSDRRRLLQGWLYVVFPDPLDPNMNALINYILGDVVRRPASQGRLLRRVIVVSDNSTLVGLIADSAIRAGRDFYVHVRSGTATSVLAEVLTEYNSYLYND